ncbi:alpha/beta hydrolase [Phytohabitans sp. ZYX-F-186]|uniref:Alpha/beta hydrolase n=1 Tax=Phytohabitans maris TaxID=3071409 RepID=A0ABU0ZTM4_9ACTN|nr:alpha/beta hydrolase [Phytohabitans sp. ZYX-F-186]MDQ7910393.1 alpha/beta hydrolase [Phytohabitans sp. ZYX-F-186]
MNTVRANGIAVHVAQLPPAGDEPAPPTAVMIHGMAGDTLASWYFTLAKPVSDAGLRVVAYDLRGHGHTERPLTGYTLDDFVDDLDALLDAIGVTGPVHLLGNSFGGTIAFAYAIRRPEAVATVTTIESSPPTPAWFHRVAYRLSQAGQPGRRLAAAREFVGATSVARELPASRLPGDALIAAITCPVLCVYGGHSRVGELAPDIRRLLPHADVVVVPGERHSLLVDRPETVREVVLPWLLRHCAKEVVR